MEEEREENKEVCRWKRDGSVERINEGMEGGKGGE